jgi:hypothetical protein
MATSNKWRLYITAPQSGDFTGVAELVLKTAPAGSQAAVGGTASASSVNPSGSSAASNAFDGTAAQWTSGFGFPQWLQYDFASPVAITNFSVTSGGSTGQAPLTFQLQYWNGSTWVAAFTSQGEYGWDINSTRDFVVPADGATGAIGAPSTKWRLKLTATNGSTANAGIGGWELRTVAGVARPFIRDGMTADVVNTGAAVMGGASGLTQLWDHYAEGEMIPITLPFNIQVGAFNTNQVVVNAYGMVSFGHDGSTYGYASYFDNGDAIPFPFIVQGSPLGNSASAFQRVYAGAEGGGATFRIRLEMFAGWDDPLDGTANTIWELTFYQAQPSKIRIDFGTSAYADVVDGGGVTAGIGDGTHATFVGLFPEGLVNVGYDVNTVGVSAEGSVSASASDDYNPPVNAIDANPETAWFADTSTLRPLPATLTYTFNEPKKIVEYVVSMGTSGSFLDLTAMARDWALEYWDGIAWQAADTQTSQSGWSYSEARTYTVVSATNDGDITLMAPTVSALLNVPSNTLLGEMTGPALTLSGVMSSGTFGQVFISVLTANGTGFGGPVGYGADLATQTLSVTALGVIGSAMAGNVGLPVPQLAGSLEGPLALPELVVGGYLATGAVFSGAARLSGLTMSGSIEAALPLPELTLDATGVAGVAVAGSALLNRLDVQGASEVGTVNTGAAVLDPLSVMGGPEGVIDLAPLALDATGQAGTIAAGVVNLAAPQVQAFADNGANIDLPRLLLDATGESGIMASGAALLLPLLLEGGTQEPVALEPLQLAATGEAGLTATGAALLLPLLLNAGTEEPAALQPLQVAATGEAGTVAAGVVNLAALQAQAFADNGANTDLPRLLLAATGESGLIASGAALLLPLLLDGGTQEPVALQPLQLAATGEAGLTASGAALLLPLLLDGGTEDPVALQPLQVAATGEAGRIATGAANLDALQVQAFADNGANIDLPSLLLAATGEAGIMAGGAAVLLPLLLNGGTQEPVALEPLQVAGTAENGANSVGNALLEKLTLAATAGPQEGRADGAVTLAQLAANGQLIGGTESTGNAVLLTMQLAATAGAGPLGDAVLTLDLLTVAGTAYASNEATGDAVLRTWTLAATAGSDVLIDGAVQLTALTMGGALVSGNTSAATLTLPLLVVDADGHYDTAGTATIALPVLQLDATGEAGATTLEAPVFTSVVLNTRNKAASTYDGLAFNSMATFNGVVLAATENGIVALTGDTDDGRAVSAVLAGGVSDLESPQFKRVLAGYVGYSAAGTVELTMITDTHHEYVYALEPRQIGELHASRVKFGRGVEGRYWQWKLANKAGADFALDALTLDVTPLSRRV